MRRTSSHGRLVGGAIAFLLAVALITPASVAGAGGSQTSGARGGALLDAVESGSKRCAELSRGDFEQIGDYVMGRMVGSTQAHESMDAMMGQSGEQRMHILMGSRFTRCGGGRAPGGFEGMMGMMGAMGMMGGGGHGFGPAGGSGQGGNVGSESMMGEARTADGDGDHDMSAGMWLVMLLVPILLAVVVVGALWSMRSGQGRASQAPLETLRQRYASGEIDSEEYSRRRGVLGGPS